MDFANIVKTKMPLLKSLAAESNFIACSNYGTDLLHYSEFIKYKEGVFIGEFIENLFGNLHSLANDFDLIREDVVCILKEIYALLDFLEKNLPIVDVDKKAEFCTLLTNAQYVVTACQLTYLRERKLKVNQQT